MINHRTAAFAALVCALPLHAQTGIPVAAFGYRNPGKSIVAAPGQVLTVSVFGVAARLTGTIQGIGDSTGLPTELKGISAEFTQGAKTTLTRLAALQQTPCPSTGACSPATTLTLFIPYDLDPNSADAAKLTVRENKATVAEIEITPALDRVHIMNTCDDTAIWIGTADVIPTGTCAPIVAHANAQLVTAAHPAQPGETLIIWAYGLGAFDRPIPANCCVMPEDVPRAAQPITIGLSYSGDARMPLRRLPAVMPTYVGGIDLYQVHFVAPARPAGLGACSAKSGNLKILLSGPTSADAADICLQ